MPGKAWSSAPAQASRSAGFPHTPADDAVEEALRLVADGSTLRAGRLLAPHGIRYVVVPETDGVNSTAEDPIPIPEGLVPALQNQLDIGSVPGPPAIEVFVNEAWIPVGAQLSGATAQASELAGAGLDLPGALVRVGLAPSKGQARTSIEQGAVSVNHEVVKDAARTLTVRDLLADRFVVLRRGKKTYGLLDVADSAATR